MQNNNFNNNNSSNSFPTNNYNDLATNSGIDQSQYLNNLKFVYTQNYNNLPNPNAEANRISQNTNFTQQANYVGSNQTQFSTQQIAQGSNCFINPNQLIQNTYNTQGMHNSEANINLSSSLNNNNNIIYENTNNYNIPSNSSNHPSSKMVYNPQVNQRLVPLSSIPNIQLVQMQLQGINSSNNNFNTSNSSYYNNANSSGVPAKTIHIPDNYSLYSASSNGNGFNSSSNFQSQSFSNFKMQNFNDNQSLSSAMSGSTYFSNAKSVNNLTRKVMKDEINTRLLSCIESMLPKLAQECVEFVYDKVMKEFSQQNTDLEDIKKLVDKLEETFSEKIQTKIICENSTPIKNLKFACENISIIQKNLERKLDCFLDENNINEENLGSNNSNDGNYNNFDREVMNSAKFFSEMFQKISAFKNMLQKESKFATNIKKEINDSMASFVHIKNIFEQKIPLLSNNFDLLKTKENSQKCSLNNSKTQTFQEINCPTKCLNNNNNYNHNNNCNTNNTNNNYFNNHQNANPIANTNNKLVNTCNSLINQVLESPDVVEEIENIIKSAVCTKLKSSLQNKAMQHVDDSSFPCLDDNDCIIESSGGIRLNNSNNNAPSNGINSNVNGDYSNNNNSMLIFNKKFNSLLHNFNTLQDKINSFMEAKNNNQGQNINNIFEQNIPSANVSKKSLLPINQANYSATEYNNTINNTNIISNNNIKYNENINNKIFQNSPIFNNISSINNNQNRDSLSNINNIPPDNSDVNNDCDYTNANNLKYNFQANENLGTEENLIYSNKSSANLKMKAKQQKNKRQTPQEAALYNSNYVYIKHENKQSLNNNLILDKNTPNNFAGVDEMGNIRFDEFFDNKKSITLNDFDKLNIISQKNIRKKQETQNMEKELKISCSKSWISSDCSGSVVKDCLHKPNLNNNQNKNNREEENFFINKSLFTAYLPFACENTKKIPHKAMRNAPNNKNQSSDPAVIKNKIMNNKFKF